MPVTLRMQPYKCSPTPNTFDLLFITLHLSLLRQPLIEAIDRPGLDSSHFTKHLNYIVNITDGQTYGDCGWFLSSDIYVLSSYFCASTHIGSLFLRN